MQNEKIEKMLEKIKGYRGYDSSFMKIYRDYKIDHTTENSKEEVLNAIIEYLDDSGFIQPYHEKMAESAEMGASIPGI